VAATAEGPPPPPRRFQVPGGGAALEVLGGPATDGSNESGARSVVLLLIHGSYHAAWCWEPHFLGFFRSKGYDTYALSLRGQGLGTVDGELPAVAGTLEVHAGDIVAFIQHLSEERGLPVVVLGHSFGGLIVQRAVADLVEAGSGAVAGMALLASVPPSGNGGLVWRYLWRSPWLALQITWGFLTRAFERDAALCQELFFDRDVPLADLEGYMQKMRDGCPAGTRLLDLRELQRSLPVPAVPGSLPVLVLGGDRDAIVDVEALDETAAAHGVRSCLVEGATHDAMLGPRWHLAAETVLAWLQELESRRHDQTPK